MQRKAELQKLYDKIQTPKEKPSKPKKHFTYQCPYRQGDMLAVKIENRYVYFVVSGIHRKAHKIKELDPDAMFVKFFERTSGKLLSADEVIAQNKNDFGISFKQLITAEHLHNYLNNYSKESQNSEYVKNKVYMRKYIRRLYCYSNREQKSFEKDLIPVGHIEIDREVSGSIFTAYQFKLVKDTLKEVFEL